MKCAPNPKHIALNIQRSTKNIIFNIDMRSEQAAVECLKGIVKG
jgi:hypothetical protein